MKIIKNLIVALFLNEIQSISIKKSLTERAQQEDDLEAGKWNDESVDLSIRNFPKGIEQNEIDLQDQNISLSSLSKAKKK